MPKLHLTRGRIIATWVVLLSICAAPASLRAWKLNFFPIRKAANPRQAIPLLPEIKNTERILILAPHPDDEILATGGLIEKAVAAGAKLKIVFLTNGDHDQIAFKIDKRTLILKPADYIAMGEQRRQESITAASFLGLQKQDLVFLGYPDYGTMAMWKDHWDDAPAYRNMLTRATAVPYPDNLSYRAPYKAESILSDLEKILSDYRPTRIFVASPADTNYDHEAAYCFLSAALLDVREHAPSFHPQILLFLVHQGAWPRPYHYHPDVAIEPPDNLRNSDFQWFSLPLSPAETARKYQAILLFKSILKGRAYLWTAFVRQNELFATLPDFQMDKASETDRENWDKALRILGVGISEEYVRTSQETNLVDVSYLKLADSLLIKASLRKMLPVKTGLSLYLFGHHSGIAFGNMPKIRIQVRTVGRTLVYDDGRLLADPPVKVAFNDNAVIFEIPLSFLGNPENIFTSVAVHRGELSVDNTAWHSVSLE